MANNFDDPFAANLIGLWDFQTGAENRDTGTDDGLEQDGNFVEGARAVDGQLVLGGNPDRFDVISETDAEESAFDLSQGTIITEFTQADNNFGAFQSIVNRGEFFNSADEGYFEIQVVRDGAVQVTHISNGNAIVETTGAGFTEVGDTVRVTYEWSETEGGQFVVDNLTQATNFQVATSAGVNMDIGDNDGTSFTFGARENVDETQRADNFIKYFDGQIDYVAVYDDKVSGPPAGPPPGPPEGPPPVVPPVVPPAPPPGPGPDGIVTGDDTGNLIDDAYTGDPNGDFVDAGDAIFPRVGSDDDIILAGGGDDTIEAGEGRDLVDGGDGDDLINTDADPLSGLPDLGFPSYNGLPAVPADPIPDDDLDTVFGGAGDDTINTGDDADVIFGGTGDDSINGGLDADLIEGNEGDDFILGGEGSDTILGNEGDDTIYGGLGPGFPDATNIRDDLPGALADPRPDNGQDVIEGGAGNDLIFGEDDNDTITGGAGNDTIDGGIDQDNMSGGDDRDTFVNVNQGDIVDGGEGFTSSPDDDFDTLDLRGSALNSNPGGTLNVQLDEFNPENGTVTYRDADGTITGTLDFVNIEEVIPCFTPGTRIATPRGERLVETLEVGDKIITRDNGIQEIRWIGARTLTGAEMAQASHMQPVLIRQGALGNGLPERDMMVSPNHRVLVANDKTALYFDESEVLVAAKHLTGLDGVDIVEASSVTYIHFMFDQHEVVLSDGAWTESFQPGDHSLAGIGDAQRQEIFELFPELSTADGVNAYQAARRSLKRHEAFLVVN